MRNYFKYITLVVFLFSALFFQFCTTCGEKRVYHEIIENYIYSQAFKMDAKDQITYYPSTDPIPMGINDTIYLSFLAKVRMASHRPGDFGGSLIACDPVPPITEPLGDSLRIETIDDFDATHPAGSNVSDLFRLYIAGYDGSAKAVRNYFPLGPFTPYNQSSNSLNLALVKKPTSNSIRFKLYIYNHVYTSGASSETPALKFN